MHSTRSIGAKTTPAPQLCFLVLISTLSIAIENGCFLANGADEAPLIEPPFPHLINPEQMGRPTVHIVSESISDELGYETLEEYVDFNLGKNAYISTGKHGHSNTYVDSQANIIYRYKPYFCIGMKPIEMEMSGFEGLWNAGVKFYGSGGNGNGNDNNNGNNNGNGNGNGDGDDATHKTMYLYGVAAVWFNAGQMPKSYSKASMVYSASKDVYREAHKWTVKDDASKSLVHLHFIEAQYSDTSQRGQTRYPLEMIQIESMETKKITRTINILSIDNYIQAEVYGNLLQVPVGYGCPNLEITKKALIEFPVLENLYMGPLLDRSHRIELEATATKFERIGGDNEGLKSSSDTISLELVRTVVKDLAGGGTLQLIRHRDTRRDTKTVLNYHYNVQYEIDLRSGTCEMSSMGDRDLVGEKERVNIEFANGLKLEMDEEMMHAIFVDSTEFYFIKSIKNAASKTGGQHMYFEKSTLVGGKPCRIIRVFSQQNSDNDIRLDRVTLWMYDEKYSQIIESYHLNIIDAVGLVSGVELAKIFDISEECYLENDSMRQGRDFAWFQLNFPLSSHYVGLLAARSLQLKDEIYARFIFSGHLSFFRAPRMELMFEDTGFTLRVLLLDLPPLQLVYNYRGSAVSIDSTTNKIEDLTVDLAHCADLCRLNHCKTMSYCEKTHACIISTQRPNEGTSSLVGYEDCPCYSLPEKASFELLFELSLHNTISQLQHQDYGALALPKQPDEIAYPRSETGVDDETYKRITIEYLTTLYNYLDQEEHRMPMLTITINVDGALIVLLPDRFELEDDPLREFRLNGRDSLDSLQDGQEDRIPPFHQGLSMHRYKMTSQSLTSPGSKGRLFTGLNYDQCALACVDSKCSSFSYCQFRQECIITDIYNVSKHMDDLVVDFECFVAQRDFLNKFNRFQGVYRPNFYKRTAPALNPSECSHSCMLESEFRCLAFDFCQAGGDATKEDNKQLGTCFYQEERALYTGFEGTILPGGQAKGGGGTVSKGNTTTKGEGGRQSQLDTGCDHYSRSYLADFVRIEYREIEPVEMGNLKTSLQEGRSVDQCADSCVNELVDCTAFQFCFNPDAKDEPMQTCTMIESRPDDGSYQVVLDQKADGKIVKEGKFFITNTNCHVFSLRKDASEAHMRDLAFNSMTNDEFEAAKNRKSSSGGLSVGGGILLYFAMTLVFAAIGCGISLAKNHNDYLRQKIDRLRLLAGV